MGGRKRVGKEVRALIFRMVVENPTWGALRIHGELLKLGFRSLGKECLALGSASPKRSRSSEATADVPQESSPGSAAMDFFTVPTLTFGVLYCSFVIGHDRRKILHFNVTRNPNALWVVQQLREAERVNEFETGGVIV